MAQQINDNFQVLASLPIDDRNKKTTIAERDAISSTRRYTGLLCFVDQTQTLYQLQSGILNSNWVGIAGLNVANNLETVIEGFYVLSAGKETLLDWEVGDKFRGWIGSRYVVGEILSLPVSLPTDVDNESKVLLTIDSNGIVPEYSKVVYVNNENPNTATIFDLNNPPITNDNTLKADVANLYIGNDASTWVYNSTSSTYVTETIIPGGSNFYFEGTTSDSGNNKNAPITRTGTVSGAPATSANHFVIKSQLDFVNGSNSVLNVYVETNGTDATGQLGNKRKPYLTINAALDALGVNGGVVNIGIGSFNSPTYTKVKSNTVFKGSGKPKYNNTVTGGTPYPNYSKTTATALVGGTIFLGEFRIPALSENIQIYDLGVDCGPVWCAAFNGDVAVDALMIANGDYENTPQDGKVLRKNMVIKNVSTIVKGPADLFHCFNLENCYEPYVDNIDVYNGFAGFVYKNIGGTAQNIKASNAGQYGIIIKTNSYAYSFSMSLRGFEIDGGTGLAIHDEGSVSGDVQEISVSDGKIRNVSYGMKQVGSQLRHLKISNVIVSKSTGNGYEFANVLNSNFLNCSSITCTGIGFSIRGTNSRISECRAISSTTVGFDIRCLTLGSPMILTGNDSISNGTYGYSYTGDVRGGHNISLLNTTGPNIGAIGILDLIPSVSILGPSGSFEPTLYVENTGTTSVDVNIARFAGNASSASNPADNVSIGLWQKIATIKNYTSIKFWNNALNTVAQISARNQSHTTPTGSLTFYTANSGTLFTAAVLTPLRNLLLGKEEFDGGGVTQDTGDKLQVTGTATVSGVIKAGAQIRLKNYTVSTLPAGVQGDTAFVTDALTPTYLGALVGGGAVVTPVFYNGSAWVSY